MTHPDKQFLGVIDNSKWESLSHVSNEHIAVLIHMMDTLGNEFDSTHLKLMYPQLSSEADDLARFCKGFWSLF